MDYRELASKIRTKYPGAYDDLDDTALSQKIVSKFPQYSDTTFDEGEPSLAERAVSAITPNAPPKTGLGESLWQGTKEMFAPGMDSLKRLLNPNAGQFGPSRVMEQAGLKVGEAVRGSLEGAPAPVKFIGGMFSDQLTPSAAQQNLGSEGIGMAASLAGPALKGAAVDPARRALGFQKSQLVSQKSPFETTRKIAQANKSAAAMLEAGAISPTGNLDDTIEGATKMLQGGSRKMSTVMDAVDSSGRTIKTSSIDASLIDDLKPKFDDEFKATGKILDDLKAFSKDGLSLKDADELRARWGKFGFQDKTVGTTEANMYREAFKSIDKTIKGHIGAVKPALLPDYVAGKAAQENAINALRGLGNKKAADLGNDVFSLPSKVLAAGQLAAGNLPAAAATAGIAQVAKRRGMAVLSTGMYGAGKALEKGVTPGFLSALQSSARRALGTDPKSKESSPPARSRVPGILDTLSPAPDRASADTGIPKSAKPMTPDNKAYEKGLQAFLRNDLQGAKVFWQKAFKLNKQNTPARRGLERLAQRSGLKDIDTYKPK